MSLPILYDFNKICRMCLKEDNTLINIFYSDAADVIREITSIELREEECLPENICIPCMDKSTEFYKFKKLCEQNNFALRSVLMHKDIGEEDCTSEETNFFEPATALETPHDSNEDVPQEYVLEEIVSSESQEPVSEEPQNWCQICNKDFPKTHAKDYHSDDHVCYVCSKQFKTAPKLQAHLKHHYCKKTFRNDHQKVVPASEKSYECTICHKGFGHKFTLKVHTKMHSAEREHLCTTCGKAFRYAHNLKIHLRRHTGEKPYNCGVCFAKFVSSSILTAHMLTHSELKRFECAVCGKKCKRSGDLNVHMRSHTGEKPYACTLCDNRYKMASHLREHVKTHTGEKNHICEVCSKSFYNNVALRIHKSCHLKQKVFDCPQCPKSFVHRTSLIAHKRKCHTQ